VVDVTLKLREPDVAEKNEPTIPVAASQRYATVTEIVHGAGYVLAQAGSAVRVEMGVGTVRADGSSGAIRVAR